MIWSASARADASVAYGSGSPQGNWVGTYGADGYVLAGWSAGADVAAMPRATVTLVQGSRWLWGSNGTDVRELQSADKSARAAGTYYDPNEIQVQLSFASAYNGNLALYALDADGLGRQETITVAGQTADLSSDLSQGAWVTVPIDVAAGGSVTVVVDRTAGPNAVLSGIFLGGGGTPPPGYTSAPQGNWVGTYGGDGYALAGWNPGGDVVSMPEASVTLAQGSRWLWGSMDSDARELQRPDKATRAAATYYDPNEIQVQLSFSSAYSGTLALYALDADNAGRRETITVAGQTLYLADDFNQGAWVTLPINVPAGGSLTIDVDRTAGPNAVLSGIFLGGGGPPPPPPAPANTAAPVISGAPVQGQSLSTSDGAWDGDSSYASSYAYQWQDCDSSGNNCAAISGATTDEYMLASSDVGHTLRAVVTASNGGGSSTQATAPTATVTGLVYGSGPYGEGNWPAGNWDPYGASSPWNTPLPPYATAQVDPNSASELGYMSASWGAPFTPWPVSNNPSQDNSSAWSHPLYWAKASDPTYTITDTGYACVAPASSACPTTMQIPDGALHALGADAWIGVVQPDGHTEIDAWDVQNANPLTGGGTLTVGGYGAQDLNGSGCCSGSTAANQGLQAGLIRGPELANGAIGHALAASVPCTNGMFVAPSTGRALGGCPGAPPDGARLQLKMSDREIDALAVPDYQKVILRAMAHYGIFITDTTGHTSQTDLLYEPAIDYTAFGNTSNTIMSYLESQGYSDPTTISINLPWSDFQVVSSCYAAGAC